MSELQYIIKGPVLTEKTDQAQEAHGQVVIKVDPRANKIQIKQAVEKMFNVKVSSVTTSNVRGKERRVGRYLGRTAGWKKATITLKEGKINFLEGL